jgi:hypothetical protein
VSIGPQKIILALTTIIGAPYGFEKDGYFEIGNPAANKKAGGDNPRRL